MSRVSLEIVDFVAHVTLDRPEKRNAVDWQMFEDLIAIGHRLMDADIRAVVLSGEGEAFCAGLDVMSFAQLAQGDPEALIMPRTHEHANDFQEVSLIWRELPVPVIAALHGVCFGAGLQIAAGADIRIAAPDCQLAIMEMKWGLIPDMGGMVLLPHLLRSDVLRFLTYTAEPISAERVEAWGLVTELNDDPRARATELARTIAGKSPSAIRAAKALISYAETHRDEAEVLHEESRAQVELIGAPDQLEVIAANMAKRTPKFK